ncbi:hypothetical protein [Thermococcus sp. AM4]|uniref:hypothetical protein n=1 Tax=Thermococcus sp. (strain AM4) TaxID=246969 RepID=UPI0011D24074|nr:hypothetical protein [Thermococcus sp. AM4]
MAMKRLLPVIAIVAIIVASVALTHHRGENHGPKTKECGLTSTNATFHCSPAILGFWGTSAVKPLNDTSFVGFSEIYVYKTENGDPFDAFFHSVKSNWTAEMGLVPPCRLWGGAWEFETPLQTVELIREIDYGIKNCTDGVFKPKPEPVAKANATYGTVEIAYYFVPIRRDAWLFTPEPVFGGSVSEKGLSASCSCTPEEIAKALEDRILALNFTRLTATEGIITAGPIDVTFIGLYRKGDEYLYLECARIEGMNLARILLVKGPEGAVRPYFQLIENGP